MTRNIIIPTLAALAAQLTNWPLKSWPLTPGFDGHKVQLATYLFPLQYVQVAWFRLINHFLVLIWF